jgi:hypothetical protein
MPAKQTCAFIIVANFRAARKSPRRESNLRRRQARIYIFPLFAGRRSGDFLRCRNLNEINFRAGKAVESRAASSGLRTPCCRRAGVEVFGDASADRRPRAWRIAIGSVF